MLIVHSTVMNSQLYSPELLSRGRKSYIWWRIKDFWLRLFFIGLCIYLKQTIIGIKQSNRLRPSCLDSYIIIYLFTSLPTYLVTYSLSNYVINIFVYDPLFTKVVYPSQFLLKTYVNSLYIIFPLLEFILFTLWPSTTFLNLHLNSTEKGKNIVKVLIIGLKSRVGLRRVETKRIPVKRMEWIFNSILLFVRRFSL